jgi:hypothetical protein
VRVCTCHVRTAVIVVTRTAQMAATPKPVNPDEIPDAPITGGPPPPPMMGAARTTCVGVCWCVLACVGVRSVRTMTLTLRSQLPRARTRRSRAARRRRLACRVLAEVRVVLSRVRVVLDQCGGDGGGVISCACVRQARRRRPCPA